MNIRLVPLVATGIVVACALFFFNTIVLADEHVRTVQVEDGQTVWAIWLDYRTRGGMLNFSQYRADIAKRERKTIQELEHIRPDQLLRTPPLPQIKKSAIPLTKEDGTAQKEQKSLVPKAEGEVQISPTSKNFPAPAETGKTQTTRDKSILGTPFGNILFVHVLGIYLLLVSVGITVWGLLHRSKKKREDYQWAMYVYYQGKLYGHGKELHKQNARIKDLEASLKTSEETLAAQQQMVREQQIRIEKLEANAKIVVGLYSK